MTSPQSPVPKTQSRAVTGILLLDKPQGLSSNQALQRAKRLFGASKAGHTGSLDPLATGLLPICFGEATKVAGLLLGSRKAYAAQLRLGITTDTLDAEGEVVAERPVPPLDAELIEAALQPLRGRILQVPPAYSAIKQGGVALYKRARRGESVEVPAREVDVQRLDAVDFDGDGVRLLVECGSGTYVRSLVRDFGERLGCGAHLTALRRLWVEPFRTPVMWTLAELEARIAAGGPAAADALLLPLADAVATLPALQLDAAQAGNLRQGRRIVRSEAPAGLCRALAPDGALVALVDVDADGTVRIRRGIGAA
jgi:tRNA pseudouridine55 synthase